MQFSFNTEFQNLHIARISDAVREEVYAWSCKSYSKYFEMIENGKSPIYSFSIEQQQTVTLGFELRMDWNWKCRH